MTPPPELVKCTHCHGWFTAATADEIFQHATGRCRARKAETPPFTVPSPPRNSISK